jgi:dolichol-phosphate mannosyltransferase
MTVVLVLGSGQLLVLGVIGEYLGRLYIQSKNRPLFIIDEIVRAGHRDIEHQQSRVTVMGMGGR